MDCHCSNNKGEFLGITLIILFFVVAATYAVFTLLAATGCSQVQREAFWDGVVLGLDSDTSRVADVVPGNTGGPGSPESQDQGPTWDTTEVGQIIGIAIGQSLQGQLGHPDQSDQNGETIPQGSGEETGSPIVQQVGVTVGTVLTLLAAYLGMNGVLKKTKKGS